MISEQLEDRLLLAAVVWDGEAGDGDWHNPLNWSNATAGTNTNDFLPGGGDDVIIGAAFAGQEVTISSNTAVNSVTSAADLTLTSGTFTVGNGAADVSTIEGSFTLQSGTLAGAGTFVVEGLFDFRIATITHSDVRVDGRLEMTGNQFHQKTIASGGRLTNNGTETGTWTEGVFRLFGGTFVNAANFEIRTDADLGVLGQAQNTFQNLAGATIVKTGTTGEQTINAEFDNDGTVVVESGTLDLRKGNSTGEADDGIYDIGAEGTLRFRSSASSRTLSTASELTGAGEFRISQNTVNVNGSYTHTGRTTIDGGFAAYNVDVTLDDVTMTAGRLTGSSSLVEIDGVFDWQGGEIRHGDVRVDGRLAISGGVLKEIKSGGQLSNNGTERATWSEGTVRLNTGTLVNLADLDITTDTDLGVLGSGPNVFHNFAGATIVKTGTTGEQTINAEFDNDGTVVVESGTLDFRKGNSTGEADDGTYDIRADGTLKFRSSSRTSSRALSSESAVVGDGELRYAQNTISVNSGTYTHTGQTVIEGTAFVAFNVPVVLTDLLQNVGTIAGNGSEVRITGTYEVGGGEIRHGNVVSEGSFLLNANGFQRLRLLSGGTLTNAGTANWTGTAPFSVDAGGTFLNAGQFTIETDANFETSPTPGLVQNLAGGTIIKTTTTGQQTLRPLFDNDGTLIVESGKLDLALGSPDGEVDDGTYDVRGEGTLEFGPHRFELRTLSAASKLQGDGEFVFGGATVMVNGSYQHTGLVTIEGNGFVSFNVPVVISKLLQNVGIISGSGSLLRVTDSFETRGGEIRHGNVFSEGSMLIADSSSSVIIRSGATLTNNGSARWTGTSSFGIQDGTFVNAGDLVLESNAQISGPGSLRNLAGATITKTAPTTGTQSLLAQFENDGTLSVESGELFITNALANFSSSGPFALERGNWRVSTADPLVSTAAIRIDPVGPITVLRANVELDGAGASLRTNNSGSPELLSRLRTIENNGRLTIRNGYDLTTTPGNLQNEGALIVGAGSTFAIDGNYTQSAAGRLTIGLGDDPATDDFGLLTATGDANLDGTFAIALDNGFGPSNAQSFQVMSFANRNDDFLLFEGLFLGATKAFDVVRNADSVVVNALTDASDLAVDPTLITMDGSGVVGQEITVGYSVENLSATPATGDWFDSIYLSDDLLLDPFDTLLGRVEHSGGLAGLGTYSESLTTELPALLPGIYRVFVVQDSRGFVPDQNRADNTALSTAVLNAQYTSLPLGGSVSGTISEGAQRFFQVEVPVDGEVRLQGTFAVADQARLFSRLGGTPSTVVFDEKTTATGLPRVSLVLDTPGIHFVLFDGTTAAGGGESFTLSAELVELAVTDVLNARGSNAGKATATILGTGFTAGTTVELIDNTESVVATAEVLRDASDRMFATFDLAGIAVGNFNVRVTEAATSVIAATPFEVTDEAAGELELELAVPDRILAGSIGRFAVKYENTGGTDLSAELFSVTVAGGEVRLEGSEASFTRQRAQALTVPNRRADDSPIGVVTAGEQGVIWFEYRRLADIPGNDMYVILDRAESADAPFDATLFEDEFRPEHITDEAWAPVFANLQSRLGTTMGEYNAVLLENAAYLESIGQRTLDVRELVILEVLRSENALAGNVLASANDATAAVAGPDLNFERVYRQQISSRFSEGALGFGWRHQWETRLVEDSDGNLLLQDNSGDRFFLKVPGDDLGLLTGSDAQRLLETYVGGSGLADALRPATEFLLGDVLRFRQADGTVLIFEDEPLTGPVKRLLRIEDAFNNRTDLDYTDGLLTTITSDSGETFTLDYDANGRLTTLTDHAGRVTTYEYDVSGDHLVRVAGANGEMLYTYDSTSTDSRQHAMLSEQSADATTSYQYDALGQLLHSERNGGAMPFHYEYGPGGEIRITDGSGSVTTMRYDASGRVAEIVDGNAGLYELYYGEQEAPRIVVNGVSTSVDVGGNLNRIVLPDGREVRLVYDIFGNVTVQRDQTGGTVTAGHLDQDLTESRAIVETFSTPTSGTLFQFVRSAREGTAADNVAVNLVAEYTDENGDTFAYEYSDGAGLSEIVYIDQTVETFVNDANGNLDLTTNRRGQTIDYTVNSHGLLTSRMRDDGSMETFAYDNAGNLVTSTDATGTTTYEYDTASRLLRLERPDGRELVYTYDAAGNRTSISDGASFEMQYVYDAGGRITEIRGASDALVTGFDYDLAGRLGRQFNANGTFTTFAYDGNANVTSIVNHSPDDSIMSRFDYTYDALNRRTTATTLDGTTTFGYDAAGQLTSVILPTGRRIEYTYDAAGNRLVASDDGVATNYVVDDQGRYTLVGTTTREYDQDGNLVLKRSADGVETRYGYDDQSQLVRVSGPDGTTTYEYDALGHRIASVSNGVRTEYLVDPTSIASVIAQYDASGHVTAHYVHTTFGLVAAFDPTGEAAFYQFDSPGSTTAITGAGGAILNEYEYLPFGEIISETETVANPFKYIGEFGVMDEGNGLQYMRNRYYEADTGSFTSLDPLRVPAVEPYGYAYNDPISNVDPTGLRPGFSIPRAPRPNFGRPRGGVDNIPNNGITRTQGFSQNFNPDTARDAACSTVGSFIGGATAGIFFTIACGTNEDTINGVMGLARQGNCGTTNVEAARQLAQLGFPGCEAATTTEVASFDPNDIIGPAGIGPENHIDGEATLPYTIRFENLDTASAPAAEVTVSAFLDQDLNLDTFEFGSFGFGGLTFDVPAGLNDYATRIQVRENLLVDVRATVDRSTRIAEWTFRSIDPITFDLPSDPFGGFLPPNANGTEGQGFANYSIDTTGGLVTGTQLVAGARIVFDANDPIDTPTIFNTIDAGPPTSSVDPLATETFTDTFVLNWAGTDDVGGAGIAGYDLFVSEDGNEYTPVVTSTTDTSATFAGEFGTMYEFYVVAFDFLGNREKAPLAADASTILVDATPSADAGGPYLVEEGSAITLFGTAFDPRGALATLTLEWDLDNDGSFDDANGMATTFDASSIDGPDSRSVSFRVTNDLGVVTIDTAQVNVANVNPDLVTEEPDETIQVRAFSRTIDFTDPASADVHTVTVNFGDGTDDRTINVPLGQRFFDLDHDYTGAGTYTVSVMIADDDGGNSIDAFDITVAASWHNASRPLDTSGDGFVSSLDALLVINYLNSNGPSRIPADQPPDSGMLDVNNDGFVTPIDALLPINYLNSGGAPEGEKAASKFTDWSDVLDGKEDEEDILALLATDQELAGLYTR